MTVTIFTFPEDGICSRTAQKVPPDFEAIKDAFLSRMTDVCTNVPSELILNFDQTSIKMVPASQWTLEERGIKQVDFVKIDDKREFTGLFGSTLSGKLLPPQLIYSGKSDRCHPNVLFPKSWHITHSDNL